MRTHYRNLAHKITQCRSATQDELISQLIPIITGWCNYYASTCSKEAFVELDHKLFWKLFRGWGKFRHPKKSGKWIARKYWHIQKHKNWTFGNDKLVLPKHSNTKITRHTKVKGESSPYDGNWTYWSKRKGEYPGISKNPHSAPSTVTSKFGRIKLFVFRGKELQGNPFPLKINDFEQPSLRTRTRWPKICHELTLFSHKNLVVLASINNG